MLTLPSTTEFGRRIPKQKFYENLDVPTDVKRSFVEQIKSITWANKLSPQTVNVSEGETVQEIEVFHVRLTGADLDTRVLNLMDRQIPYHLLFLLERSDGKFQLFVTYKEASQGGKNIFQLRQSYHTEWKSPNELTINLSGLNMDTLYENLVRQIAGTALLTAEMGNLKEAVEQIQQREKLQKQIEQLKNKMKKEKQLARQMELRREIQKLEKECK